MIKISQEEEVNVGISEVFSVIVNAGTFFLARSTTISPLTHKHRFNGFQAREGRCPLLAETAPPISM